MSLLNRDRYRELLRQTFLFSGADNALLSRVLSREDTAAEIFEAGRIIASPESFRRGIGVVASGSARVRKPEKNGKRVVMSMLERGQIFGAVTLFGSRAAFITEVEAGTTCEVLFISADCLRECIKSDFALAERYLDYLTDRIFFLNRKIDSFAGASAEDKFASFLADNAEEVGGRWRVVLPENIKSLAEYLNMGRASLYRVMDGLIAEGVIERDGSTIHIRSLDEINRL